mgnify:CR=1 FL=1
MTAERLKFLEFIQNIITRMNANSFQIKAMCIAVISALFAVYAASLNKQIILVVFAPLILCCFLDMYYLWQEKRFRALYSDTLKDNTTIQDFDLGAFENYHKGFGSYLKVFSSMVIWCFYGVLVACNFILWGIL